VNAAVLLTDDPPRFDGLAVIAPYMRLEADPAPPDPEWLEALRADWHGFIVPFMHNVFTEPDSSDVIAEMIAIGLEATPEVAITQEFELDWKRPARLLGTVACPTLAVHGEADAPVPVSLAQSIVAAMPNARLERSPKAGTGLTSAPPSSSTLCCWRSSSTRRALSGTIWVRSCIGADGCSGGGL
jgi:pimeloyl-ACP methyl ester carboxylesterase